MIRSLRLAFDQLGDPAIQRVIWRSLAITLAALAGLMLVIGLVLSQISVAGLAWLDAVIGVLGGVGAAILAVFLFPAILGLVAGAFLDEVVAAVERRHYPDQGPPRQQSRGETLAIALKFTAAKLALNLVALVLVGWIPLVNALVFYLLNGYLIGREFFELVGPRRLPPDRLTALRRSYRGTVVRAGIAMAVLTTVPVLNLLMPIIGAAFMVHVFQRVKSKSSYQL